ncbi:MAG: SMP-30/gluconolactonase/LRE family protein, partial [Planctomycetota bacterium]
MKRPSALNLDFGRVLWFGLALSGCLLGSVFAADKIQPTGTIEKVAGGFQFTEGPAWNGSELFFTDIPASTIHRLKIDGSISPLTTDSKHSNGIIFSGRRMLACQMDGQVVEYDSKTGLATVLADEYAGKRFNAPNDLTIDPTGGIYFTDP